MIDNIEWRGDGAAERASLENWRPRKGSASSNLAPSANDTKDYYSFMGRPAFNCIVIRASIHAPTA